MSREFSIFNFQFSVAVFVSGLKISTCKLIIASEGGV